MNWLVWDFLKSSVQRPRGQRRSSSSGQVVFGLCVWKKQRLFQRVIGIWVSGRGACLTRVSFDYVIKLALEVFPDVAGVAVKCRG